MKVTTHDFKNTSGNNAWAWFTWVFSTLVLLSTIRNPLYLILILLILNIVSSVLDNADLNPAPPFSTIRVSMFIILMASLFNAFTSHQGNTLLITIPGKLPYLSGPVTLEAMLYGGINGLVLAGLLVGFRVLYQAIPIRSLIRMVPSAFYPLAVVSSIAITFIPATIRQYHQIREAQTIRGHHFRQPGDWLPILIPLLVGGLERALQLAEAMTARGLSSREEGPSNSKYWPVALAVSILAIVGWLAGGFGKWKIAGEIFLLLSAMAILGVILFDKFRNPQTNYFRDTWQAGDWFIAIGAALPACACSIPWWPTTSLAYNPYPTISLPDFETQVAIVLLGLLAPLFITRQKRT